MLFASIWHASGFLVVAALHADNAGFSTLPISIPTSPHGFGLFMLWAVFGLGFVCFALCVLWAVYALGSVCFGLCM